MSKTSTSGMSVFVDPDEAPRVTQEDIDRAVFRVGRKPVERGQVGVAKVPTLIDAGVVEYFKRKAGGSGYEALINEALGEYIRAHPAGGGSDTRQQS